MKAAVGFTSEDARVVCATEIESALGGWTLFDDTDLLCRCFAVPDWTVGGSCMRTPLRKSKLSTLYDGDCENAEVLANRRTIKRGMNFIIVK